jgi:hypothetical protein
MPSAAEITAQLTGPGGPFEVVTEPVGGVEMKVYKDRFRSLREVAALATAHGDKTFIVHGDRRISFSEFSGLANGVSAALRDGFGIGRGDRVAVLSANNPEWCLSFWGTVQLGGILVGLNGWWKNDEILYGLTDSGAKVLVADRRRYERIADEVAAGSRAGPGGRLPGRRRPVRAGRRPAAPPLRRAHRLTVVRAARQPDRRGRPGRHLLHERHDGPAQGRGVDPPEHDRQPPEHRAQHRGRDDDRRRRADPRR